MKLNDIFSSHMVFAANLPVRIYGTGKGEAKITFAGQTKTVISSAEKWLVEFPHVVYGGPYDLEFDTEAETVVLNDIYVGEVYLFAGQSNMGLRLRDTSTDPSLYESNEKLRLFDIKGHNEKNGFNYYSDNNWVKSKKDEVGDWSAIAYLAGIEIANAKNIAVGIITCAQGASIIESWVPEGVFEKSGIDFPFNLIHPSSSPTSCYKFNVEGYLYSRCFLKATPFSVSAVVWYQGESDSSLQESEVYKQELAILIDTWRKDLLNSKLPFIIIQLADYDNASSEGWKNVQKAQYEIQYELDNVTTVICADVCESNNIHPPTKTKLSKRVSTVLQSLISVD